MIRLMPAESGSFHNFKCGEVFCLSSEQYDITCCLCGVKVGFLDFPQHFQEQHLSDTLNKTNEKESLDKDSSNRIENNPKTDSHTALFNEQTPNIKPEFDEEVSAFSWDEHFQDGEVPIDMDTMENMAHIQEDSFDEKEENKSFDIGEMGAKIDAFCGEEDDDINIGIENDEWLHEKYSYDNIPTDEDDPSELEGIDMTDIRVNLYDSDNESDGDDDDIKNMHCDTDNKDSDKEFIPIFNIETVPCELCKRVFNSKIGLKIHMKAVHKNGPTIKGKSIPKKPFKEYNCEDCDEHFLTERALTAHRYKHTGIFCNICGKTFSQIGNLVRHRIRHTGEKPFQCKECDKTFFTERERKAHMMKHTGILPIICEICGKRCRDHGVLTAHMRRHTGERPAKCNICGKSFFCGYDLNVHSVTHTSERPFKCEICGSTFQLKKSLRVHKKIHSKDRKFPCRICGKIYSQSSGLTSHMRKHDTANIAGISNKLFDGIDSADDVADIAVQASSAAIVDVSVAHDGTQWGLL